MSEESVESIEVDKNAVLDAIIKMENLEKAAASTVEPPHVTENVKRQLDGEEEFHVADPEDMPGTTEAVFGDMSINWEPTHIIGDYIVQERTFVNGLRYWVEENGKRRRPVPEKGKPLRPYIVIPDAEPKILTREELALAASVLFEFQERNEDWKGNVAERIDGVNVRLSLYDTKTREYSRFIVSIPEQVEVMAIKMT